MQQLSPRHLVDPMFASLRRWTAKTPVPSEITPEITITSMDAGNVAVGLSAAWGVPHGWMISHEEVAAVASAYPERILGIASADLSRPMDAVRQLRRAVKQLGFEALAISRWLRTLPPT